MITLFCHATECLLQNYLYAFLNYLYRVCTPKLSLCIVMQVSVSIKIISTFCHYHIECVLQNTCHLYVFQLYRVCPVKLSLCFVIIISSVSFKIIAMFCHYHIECVLQNYCYLLPLLYWVCRRSKGNIRRGNSLGVVPVEFWNSRDQFYIFRAGAELAREKWGADIESQFGLEASWQGLDGTRWDTSLQDERRCWSIFCLCVPCLETRQLMLGQGMHAQPQMICTERRRGGKHVGSGQQTHKHTDAMWPTAGTHRTRPARYDSRLFIFYFPLHVCQRKTFEE